ncbi:MAG: MotA/TolQ/ExbB proton channel family protein, partial [Terrimicrobiaceae bacterium]|nr:MotA/TolQ/ExbB proton channel family protein [Terrimicrobiaceae bacterium]
RMHRRALSAAEVAFNALTQSTSEKAARIVLAGEDESRHGGGHNETLEHVMLFGDIAANMMFDGWIAVGICVLMMIGGGAVAAQKWIYLNKIEKGTRIFLHHWKQVSSDLTAMDLDNPEAARDFGGKLDAKTLKLLKDSPLYHVYHIGAEEIRHRLGNGRNKGQGLSARSIQAIRAALDAGLVHEQHRLYNGIVILTTGIAGGPYVGLLGTVVGVMITFALIAKSGEVEVNSIAPGIASALLATTFGLLVAIPCLFLYNYLNTRMKDMLSSMQVFIDEFVAKIAEFYPPPGEAGVPVPIRQIRNDEDAAAHQARLEKDGLAAARED